MSRPARTTATAGKPTRGWLARRRRVTPVPDWDAVELGGLPEYDVDEARADALRRVEQHLAMPSIDEAHGDVVDRLVRAVTDGWRRALHAAYVARHQELEMRRLQGVEHRTYLDGRLAALIARRAEAERTRTEALARLVGPLLPVVAFVLLLVGIVAQFVDVMLAKNVFDIVVNQSESLSWFVAIGLTLTAAVLMVSVGIALRHGGRRHRLAAGALASVWLFLGLALAYLRMREGSLLGDADEPADGAIALAMFVLYLAAGLDIAYHSHALHDSDRESAIGGTVRVRRLDRALHPLEAMVTRVRETIEGWPRVLERLDETYLDELARIGHHESELKAMARDRLTLGLEDPTRASLVYRLPHEPSDVESDLPGVTPRDAAPAEQVLHAAPKGHRDDGAPLAAARPSAA